jgi:hypothetical protein
MAEADRIAAALRYQQELDAAQRPATMNPNIAAQGLKSRNRIAAALASQPPSWSGEAIPMKGRATILPFQDSLPGSVMNKRSLALPGIVAGAVNAFTAPGRAYQGGYDVDESGNITPKFNAPEEAANVAMNVMGGGLGASRAAGGAPSGALGMFIGKSAKNWDAAAATKALEMEKAGVDPKMIWQETGTWKGPEGQWRQEISDKSSKITDDVYNQISANKQFKGPMSQALRHEELYKAYPQSLGIPTTMFADIAPSGNLSPGRSGTFQTPQITVGGPSTMDQRSVALHELQHAIQHREGFARGGSPNAFKPNDVFSTKALEDAAIIDKLMRGSNLNQLEAKQRFETLFKKSPEAGAFSALERIGTGKDLDAARDAARLADKPIESYRRLAGEAEARATQKRRNMTTEERRAKFPVESYDVPINQLIIRQ